jgi:uncharacterized protein YycO
VLLCIVIVIICAVILIDDKTVNLALRADGTLDARGSTQQAFSEVASWLRSQQQTLDDIRRHPCYAAHWQQKAKLRVYANEPLSRKLGDEERKYVDGILQYHYHYHSLHSLYILHLLSRCISHRPQTVY